MRSGSRRRFAIDWTYAGALAAIVGSALLAVRFVDLTPASRVSRDLPFDVNDPDRAYVLPAQLKEISGVAISQSPPVAWAVNDEEGRLFRIDLEDGSVDVDQTFAKAGDYEGVELLDGEVVVARSDGTLWRVGPNGTEKVQTGLGPDYDVEGLAWDRERHRLLVACKGKAGDGPELDHVKAVYDVRLPAFEWSKRPAFVIARETLRRFLDDHPEVGRRPRDADAFAPSAIGIDPITKEIYVLSTTSRMLVLLDPAATRVREVVTLERGVHAQPEGLAFDAAGSLYISNEGRRSSPMLYRFDRRDSAGPSDGG